MTQHGSVDPSSIVHPTAVLGLDVTIGPFCTIGPGSRIGDGSRLEERVSIGMIRDEDPGEPPEIGPNSIIRSGTVIYRDVRAGSYFQTGHNAVVRPGAVIGTSCSLGTAAEIQGASKLGDRVRMHSNSHIGEGTTLEDDVLLYPNVLITNDPNPPSDIVLATTIGAGTVLCSGVSIMPGCNIGSESVVLPLSRVSREFIEPGNLISGNPAKSLGSTGLLRMANDRSKRAYPWTKRFSWD